MCTSSTPARLHERMCSIVLLSPECAWVEDQLRCRSSLLRFAEQRSNDALPLLCQFLVWQDVPEGATQKPASCGRCPVHNSAIVTPMQYRSAAGVLGWKALAPAARPPSHHRNRPVCNRSPCSRGCCCGFRSRCGFAACTCAQPFGHLLYIFRRRSTLRLVVILSMEAGVQGTERQMVGDAIASVLVDACDLEDGGMIIARGQNHEFEPRERPHRPP